MPESSVIITGQQLRAARGFMAWDREELGRIAGVSPETVKNIEHGVFHPNAETLGRLLKALAAHNVQLVNLDLVPGCVISGVLHVAPRGKK
jgi:transcriptional regulator with XRE-family HTH domain